MVHTNIVKGEPPAGKTNTEGLTCQVNTNNQLTTCSIGYDAAGNTTSNGTTSYTYDAENRVIWTSGYRYIYDGKGQRVEKCQAASATTACPTSGTTGTLYWRGTGSDTLAETDLAGNDQEEYLFFNGQRIARRDTTSTGVTVGLHYYFSDHLGSHGVVETVTTSGTTSCDQDIDYYPYGGVEHDYCPNVAQNYKFTGKERDSESGLDYFVRRHHASSLGRFMSPDPAGGSLSDPQTLNRYAYVRNSPLAATDPTGEIIWWNDSKRTRRKGETTDRTNAQRKFENRLEEMQNSKDPGERAKGAALQNTYDRLQASKATFEVINQGGSEASYGEITYQGNDHFTISLAGDTAYHLSDNQRLAHEFEHGRQVLDGEMSFANYTGDWRPWAHDRTDEAKGFAAGFDIERAQPGQGSFINSIQQAIDAGGVAGGATRLGRGDSPYHNLEQGPINVDVQTPSIYRVPQ